MPRSCSVCNSPQSAEINKAIVRKSSKNDISVRFGVTESAVQRHRARCLMVVSKQKPDENPSTLNAQEGSPGSSAGAVGPVRFESDDPKSLISTACRLVDEALKLLEHAKNAGDSRTALTALREARDGLSLLMKTAGMLGSEGTTINITDARRQSAVLLSKLTEDELRAIASLATGAPALRSADVIDVESSVIDG